MVCIAAAVGSGEQNQDGTLELAGKCYPTKRGERHRLSPLPWSECVLHHHLHRLGGCHGCVFLPPHACNNAALFCKQASGWVGDGIAIRKQRHWRQKRTNGQRRFIVSQDLSHWSLNLSHAGKANTHKMQSLCAQYL